MAQGSRNSYGLTGLDPDDSTNSMVLNFNLEDWLYKALTTDNEINISENVLNILDTTVKYIYNNRPKSYNINFKHVFQYKHVVTMLRNVLKEFPLMISHLLKYQDGAFIEYLITHLCELSPELMDFTKEIIIRNFSFQNLNSPSIYIYIGLKNMKNLIVYKGQQTTDKKSKMKTAISSIIMILNDISKYIKAYDIIIFLKFIV